MEDLFKKPIDDMETQTNLNYFNRKVFGAGIFLILIHITIYLYMFSSIKDVGFSILPFIINPFIIFASYISNRIIALITAELVFSTVGLLVIYAISKYWYKLFARIVFYLILIPISILTIIIIYGLLFIPPIHS
jgi:branched-subunit amino acid transport protein AzlD